MEKLCDFKEPSEALTRQVISIEGIESLANFGSEFFE